MVELATKAFEDTETAGMVPMSMGGFANGNQ